MFQSSLIGIMAMGLILTGPALSQPPNPGHWELLPDDSFMQATGQEEPPVSDPARDSATSNPAPGVPARAPGADATIAVSTAASAADASVADGERRGHAWVSITAEWRYLWTLDQGTPDEPMDQDLQLLKDATEGAHVQIEGAQPGTGWTGNVAANGTQPAEAVAWVSGNVEDFRVVFPPGGQKTPSAVSGGPPRKVEFVLGETHVARVYQPPMQAPVASFAKALAKAGAMGGTGSASASATHAGTARWNQTAPDPVP